jgi:hypothetical protein
MPLLVGLLDASAVRRSLDIPLSEDGVPAYSEFDLDELVAKQSAGGGMLNSIANMANSILGAGMYNSFPFSSALVYDHPSFQGIIGMPSPVVFRCSNALSILLACQVYPTP